MNQVLAVPVQSCKNVFPQLASLPPRHFIVATDGIAERPYQIFS